MSSQCSATWNKVHGYFLLKFKKAFSFRDTSPPVLPPGAPIRALPGVRWCLCLAVVSPQLQIVTIHFGIAINFQKNVHAQFTIQYSINTCRKRRQQHGVYFCAALLAKCPSRTFRELVRVWLNSQIGRTHAIRLLHAAVATDVSQ